MFFKCLREILRSICAKFRGDTPRNFAETLREQSRRKNACVNLREISQSFLR